MAIGDFFFGTEPNKAEATWHSSPNTRGSADILWSCIVTLFLCTWSAVHLNVPGYKEDIPRLWYDPRGWVTKQQWRKVAWLIFGLFAPEYVAFVAWYQRREAHRMTERMTQALAKHQKRNRLSNYSRSIWTHKHSFLAISGGFAVQFQDLSAEHRNRYAPINGGRKHVTLSSENLEILAENKPSILTAIMTEEIDDKSKADALTKFIVCVQALWFVAYLIGRLAQQLPCSLLELNVFVHASCALLIYILWWDKPFDVAQPIYLSRGNEDSSWLDQLWNSPIHNIRSPRSRNRLDRDAVETVRDLFLGDLFTEEDIKNAIIVLLAFTGAGGLYGLVHLLAWDYSFPSHTAKTLWKISGIAIAASGPSVVACMCLAPVLAVLDKRGWLPDYVSHILALVISLGILVPLALFYVLARVYLVVGCFLTFPYLPGKVFEQPQWVNYWPHI